MLKQCEPVPRLINYVHSAKKENQFTTVINFEHAHYYYTCIGWYICQLICETVYPACPEGAWQSETY